MSERVRVREEKERGQPQGVRELGMEGKGGRIDRYRYRQHTFQNRMQQTSTKKVFVSTTSPAETLNSALNSALTKKSHNLSSNLRP